VKIRPTEDKLFYTDRQTNVTKLIGGFRNFANALKNYLNTVRVYYGTINLNL